MVSLVWAGGWRRWGWGSSGTRTDLACGGGELGGRVGGMGGISLDFVFLMRMREWMNGWMDGWKQIDLDEMECHVVTLPASSMYSVLYNPTPRRPVARLLLLLLALLLAAGSTRRHGGPREHLLRDGALFVNWQHVETEANAVWAWKRQRAQSGHVKVTSISNCRHVWPTQSLGTSSVTVPRDSAR